MGGLLGTAIILMMVFANQIGLTYTFALSLLISFSGNLELFKIHNPELVHEMTWTFHNL